MKITVCEFPDEAPRKEAAWMDLARFLHTSPTDVVVLPEMPFCDWQIFMTRTIDPAVWQAARAVPRALSVRRTGHDLRVGRGVALHGLRRPE